MMLESEKQMLRSNRVTSTFFTTVSIESTVVRLSEITRVFNSSGETRVYLYFGVFRHYRRVLYNNAVVNRYITPNKKGA